MPAFDKGNLRGHSVFSQKVEKKQKKIAKSGILIHFTHHSRVLFQGLS